ncbi:MAG TPA: hypothetical protein ENG50_04350 [Candidatus Altiarchaeales archaeon]|nr:hypothetical protein [Candidatus Altiarchaeales archaeon]
MDYNAIEMRIKEEVKKFLQKYDGKVICFIKFGDKAIPGIISSITEVESLVWNRKLKTLLATYLKKIDKNEKVCIIGKGCDSRAILELMKENQVERDNIFIIGVCCEGMLNENNELFDACKRCKTKMPIIYDVLICEREEVESEEESSKELDQDLHVIEEMPPKEKLRYWMEMLGRCIACMACVEVCPMCYCKECVINNKDVGWFKKTSRKDMFFFHIIRAYHLAGRCIDCGVCEEVCPESIKLTLLYRKVNKDIKTLFGYEPGISKEKNPLLSYDIERDKGIEK